MYDLQENVPKLPAYSHSIPRALLKTEPVTAINNVNDNRSNAIKTPTGDLTLRSADISSSDVILAPTKTADDGRAMKDDNFVSGKGHGSINIMAADTQIVDGGESMLPAATANVIKTSAAAGSHMISVGGVGGRQIGQESGY